MSPSPISASNNNGSQPVYIGSKGSGTFEIRIVNPLPDKTYTYSHNPYPVDPFNYMSYYTFNAC